MDRVGLWAKSSFLTELDSAHYGMSKVLIIKWIWLLCDSALVKIHVLIIIPRQEEGVLDLLSGFNP